MTVSTALVLLLQTSFVLISAFAFGYIFRARPALRVAIYRLSLLGVIALAIGSPWLNERPNPVVPVRWSTATTMVSVTQSPAKPTSRSTHEETSTQERHVATAPSASVREPIRPLDTLPWLWLAGVAILTVHLAIGWIGLLAVRRRCRPIDDPQVLATLNEIAREAHLSTPRLFEGAAVGIPFVAGAIRPSIFIPRAWAREVDAEVLQAVLRHEVAHIANGDLRWSLVHRIASIPLWPQALLWGLRRPMLAASEELCDGQVLASGIPKTRYAEYLLNLRDSFRARPCPSLGIGAVSSRSSLGKRVEAILNSHQFGPIRISRTLSILLSVAAVALATSATLLFARPSAQVPADPTVGWTAVKPYSGNIRIVSEDGKPVADARAWLLLQGGAEPTSHGVQVLGSTAAVNAENIPPETVGVLVVEAPGYGLGSASLWPAPRAVTEIVLPRAVSLQGRLLLSDGTPAAGVKVRTVLLLKKSRGPFGYQFVFTQSIPNLGIAATTSSDGTFQLDGLPPNVKVAYDVDDPRYAHLRMADRVDLTDESLTRANDVKLQLAAQISGVVTRDGKPIPNLLVRAQGNHQIDRDSPDAAGQALTDANGRYLIGNLPAATYNLAPDLLLGRLDRDVTALAKEAIAVKPGETKAGLDFELVSGAIIEGTVTDESGKPIAKTDVGIYGPAHPDSSAWVQCARTDKEGRFLAHVPPGKQRIYVMDSRYTQNMQTIEVADGTRTTVNFKVAVAKENPFDVAMGTEETDATPPEQRPAPAGPVASFAPGKPFYGPVKLANGVTVTLAYVQNDLHAPHNLWKPDGSRADAADVQQSLNMTGFNHDDNDVRRIFLGVDIKGASRGDYDCLVQVPHQSNWNVYQSYGDADDRSMSLATFQAHETLRVTDMRFGVAAGPYKVHSSAKMGQAPLYARTGSRRIDPPLGGVGGTSIVFQMPKGLEGKDVKLAAYDKTGKALELVSYETEDTPDKVTHLPSRAFSFSGAMANEIDHVELRLREYCWTTFKGIHLYSNRG
jgi:beta-lactamase regulating signal transducer with metallopeptidase domain